MQKNEPIQRADAGRALEGTGTEPLHRDMIAQNAENVNGGEEAGAVRGKLNDRGAKCPYFQAHTGQAIYCECPIPGAAMRLTFPTREDKKRQYKGFCCRMYKNCELYEANGKKYEEEE